MDLHVQLPPEAQARLAAQRRISTLTSIITSLLVLLLIGIILLLSFSPKAADFTPKIVSYQVEADEIEEVKKPKMTRATENKPSAPSSSIAKVIAENTTSTIAIPVPEINVPDPSIDFNNSDDFGDGSGDDFGDHLGDGWGNGEGVGVVSEFKNIPSTMRERCSKEDRLRRLAENGGNEQCEEAVVKALRWLKKTQNKDGSWCDQHKVAMTGFALLAFLGHCETPKSEEFGDAVTRAIVYLVNISMKNRGKMADDFKDWQWSYDHSIATYALGEAAIFCIKLGINIPKLNDAVKKAGDWIIEHQHLSGSWDYHYQRIGGRGGDNSVGLWHIQALKACKHTGLWRDRVFKGPIRSALNYIESSQDSSGGIAYDPSINPDYSSRIGFSMTGGGMLAFQIWGESDDRLVEKGALYIKKNAKFDYNSPHSDLYRHYYHAQAMLNRGGADWEFYNNLFRDELLNNQNADGSWKDVGGGKRVLAAMGQFQGNSDKAIHYRTCLVILMLEVYYRFLPATGSKN